MDAKNRVFSVHEHELRNDVDSAMYEKEVGRELEKLKSSIKGLVNAYFLKGFKGKRAGRYAILWVWQSSDTIKENFGTFDNPTWPKEWLYYENTVLAKYLTCHPDKINFSCYEIIVLDTLIL